MPQDAFTLRYLCEEINEIVKGGKINKITQPTPDVTVFTVYTVRGNVRKLLLDVNPSSPRIGIIEEEPEQIVANNNFCMLLKKHMLSATIDSVSVVGFDRIVKIDVTPSREFFDAPQKTVFVELMGRYSNVILTENGLVMGGNRGVNTLDNNVRPLITGRKYVFPPVGDKKLPQDRSLIEYFEQNHSDIKTSVISAVQGVADSTAREIEKKYYEKNVEFNAAQFFQFLNDYLYRTQKKPCVIINGGEIKDVCVYPYETIMGDKIFFDELYLAEEEYFRSKAEKKNFSELKSRLRSKTETATKKAKKRLNAIISREKDAESAEENKIKGELILSNIYKIRAGDRVLNTINFYNNENIEIPLDPNLSAAENAQNYFKKYGKQKRAAVALVSEKKSATEECEYLNGVSDEIEIAEDIIDLKAIEEELVFSGLIKTQNKSVKKKNVTIPYRNYVVSGFNVKVGRNNVENDKLTFSAKPVDIWLHAKDYHSSHVVIETEGKEVTEDIIVIAAEICAYFSKGKEGGKTEIVYTQKKNVKKPPKSKLGFCTYTNFKSISVIPDKHAESLKN